MTRQKRILFGRRRAGDPHALSRLAFTALLAVIAVLASGCKQDEPNTYAPPPPPEVIVANPVVREVTSYLSFTGVVEASETVDLRARVAGFLQAINFRPGQQVEKGDVLFVIDKRQYQAELDEADAAVRAQKAALAGAESDAALARELAEKRAGPAIDAITKEARRDAAAAEVARLEALLAEAQLNVEYCSVTAPIDGRITRNLVDIGNLVGATTTTHLATIVKTEPVYVPIDINESDVLAIRRELEQSGELGQNEPGQIAPDRWRPCELGLADQGDSFPYKGRVDYVEPQLNTDTGALRVRTRFANEDGALVPGFFARLRFAMSSGKAMLVPDAALLSDQRGRYAVVVDEESKVQVRRVEIGALEGDSRVVETGLDPDDRVIVLGTLKARPGAKVTPKTQEAAAESR